MTEARAEASAEIGVQEAARVVIGVEVPLPSVRAAKMTRASLFLL